MKYRYIVLGIISLFLLTGYCKAEDTPIEDDIESAKVENDLGSSREGSRTDDEVVKREEEAIKLDGLNVAQLKQLREQAEKFTFQAEVNRMMKLIINSLYRNKEIYLRELISNASDALDKIRLLSLTDSSVLNATPELSIRIKADKEAKMLHITDTGIGMTKQDLINNLGTIAKSGTAEFLTKMQEAADQQDLNDMIGQFGVGFYSAFLVSDRVIVTTKHNDDKQYIWESDANSYTIVEDPRGNTLKRGTTVSLQLKPEALDFLEADTIQNLVKKYSQFINFPIYMWTSKTETVEEPLDENEITSDEDKDKTEYEQDEADVEEVKEEPAKTKKVEKTIWDWEVVNTNKPIWSRKMSEISEDEYNEFYRTLTKDRENPLGKVHFVAEGEVTFKSLLFIPKSQPNESFSKYGHKNQNIKLYVRRVFITDEFTDLIPNYLNFIQGVVDSDDLPLNVSRETLQQHKLIKVIRKKLIRKALDMMKKLPKDDYDKFWKEYSTNIKLGVVEDPSNRTRLSKLLRFYSSHSNDMTSLADYVSRMKPDQEYIYYLAGLNKKEVETSPFVERLLAKGLEVLYLVEAVDEYCVSNLPEFEGKKFQNVGKEGLKLPGDEKSQEIFKKLKEQFNPLVNWLGNEVLKNDVARVVVSERLTESPCALVAHTFGWTGNMERLAMSNAHQKANDPSHAHYLNQKKTLEINPRHPIIKELLRRVENGRVDENSKDIAIMLFRTATLRSGYVLQDTTEFANSVEHLLRETLGIPLDERPDLEEELSPLDDKPIEVDASNDQVDDEEDHDEL